MARNYLIFLTLLVLTPPLLKGEIKLIELTQVGDSLKLVKTNLHELKPSRGDTIIVQVSNVDASQPGWVFKFGGNEMKMVESIRPLRYSIEVTTESPYQFTFTDDTDPEVKMTPLDIQGKAAELNPQESEEQSRAEVAKLLLASYDRKRNEAIIYFDAQGLPFGRQLPTDLDDNDVIHIYVVSKKDEVKRLSVTVAGTIASGQASILGTGALSQIKESGLLTGTGGIVAEDERLYESYFGSFGPYTAGSITVEVTKKVEGGKEEEFRRGYTMRINPNYLGGFRIGVGNTKVRFSSFVLESTSSPDTSRIVDRSDPDGEIRPYLTIVLYAWRFWENKFWNGRDINEPPSFLDRVNPVVGIGLKDLWEEYIAGVSFEIARGLDFFYAVHYAKVTELSGDLKVGDSITGSQIPTVERWKSEEIFGLSIDLIIAGEVVGSLFSSGSGQN